MDATITKVALLVLRHHDIIACIVGEVALNYYNVPRAIHGSAHGLLQMHLSIAAELLCSTGLFERESLTELNIYTEYKRGFPRLRSTSWTAHAHAIVIFPASAFGLQPLEKTMIRTQLLAERWFSKEITDIMPRDEIATSLPLPRLPSLMVGLCRRYLDTGDDVAMIAAEQLVDGMDLDEEWCERHLRDSSPEISQLMAGLVAGKASRIDDFSTNQVTCFVRDRDEADKVRKIPGYE
ncbi:hypothetical protein QBC46DRAFT_336994 [Diplogelasinospora grovesii]|uniref:Uncharacterized protein n=1 Tax=Diplogelasinospora grovesii TaxID=303347 RepID=A0AAN6NG41_9PEZI|nr:hypothetical protein QBC46DRAFT_336994 [Diplogelasinospora grovesii]